MIHSDPERGFEEHVATRFRLYSGLFLELPYDLLQRVGRLLPVFAEHCRKGLQQKHSPSDIVASFFAQNPSLTDVPRSEAIFLFLQLIERQVVLFDALEDASFGKLHDLDAPGSVTHLLNNVFRDDRRDALAELLGQTATRIVLTAHPTQFYPDTVQGVIDDLRPALNRNDPAEVERLLLQLGKTRFSNPQRPSPVDEARSVLRVLDEVFYDTLADIAGRILVGAYGRARLPQRLPSRPNLQIGFWPGGDRDGNPFVTAATTREVARMLKERVLERHHATARALARHLTFDGVHGKVQAIVARLRTTWLSATDPALERPAGDGAVLPYASPGELTNELLALRDLVVRDHQSLFLDEIDDFIVKVHLFGFHFASLDLRQSSDVFFATLRELAALDEVAWIGPDDLLALGRAQRAQEVPLDLFERLLDAAQPLPAGELARLSPLARDTLEVLRLVEDVQAANGELALHRLVISHTRGPEDALLVLLLARVAGLGTESAARLDVVPLFESIADLDGAEAILGRMLGSPSYRAAVAGRGDRQIVMMGFSDGTKDGGYLTANWSIRRAKQHLSALGRRHGVRIIFFDGRGGPPARGGGNTHRFYRSRDLTIEQWETQLTIQGQTINSNFGSRDMAVYHVEQLYTANLENLLAQTHDQDPPQDALPLLDELSGYALAAYRKLRDHPLLVPFLAEASPLPVFDHLTHASRPVSRGGAHVLDLDKVRAIPLVATWSVLKIQISGFYGVGAALEQVIAAGREAELQRLYRRSRFFRALLDNTAMSVLKSRFDITAHLEHDARFGPLWSDLRDEAARVERSILRITGQPWLLANDPMNRASIRYRDEIILPLLVIVHDAFARYLAALAHGDGESRAAVQARRMAQKGIAAVINATRNAA